GAAKVEPARPLEEIFPLLQPIPPQRGQLLRRFTVTQLINFQRCARQYYFERMLRTPGKEERAVWNDAEAPEPPANLTATLKGAVIHRFCETFRDGEDLEARLTESYEEVLAQRQTELVGRAFDIDKTEAVRALKPLAQNYLQSDVFRRVEAASGSSALAGESPSENHRLKSVPLGAGLWSELRFRLRRSFGILTGTIDKLLITPSTESNSVDVEIIDFKTNRFSAAAKRTPKRVRTVAAKQTAHVALPKGQAVFNFEAVTEEVVPEAVVAIETSSQTVDEQIASVADDYQLQMQAYALALR